MMVQHMLVECNKVIFLNIIVILIMQKYITYLLMNEFCFTKIFLVFMYNYFAIFDDFLYLKLCKILELFAKLLWMFYENL